MEKYETALILGLGYSGEAAARLLLGEGTDVQVVDRNDSETLKERARALSASGANVRLGQTKIQFGEVSVCIVSPGIPSSSEWVMTIKDRGIPVISELELGWSRAKCRVLAVSGSNGKSTLVKLCAESLDRAGLNVAIAGNYEAAGGGREEADGCQPRSTRTSGEVRRNYEAGRALPVSCIVAEREALDWLVLEVSSFQMEAVKEFRPDIGVLLNVFPNHLDRHGELLNYERMKSRLFSRMVEDDAGIVSEDVMPWIAPLADSEMCKTTGIGPAKADESQPQRGEARGHRWISFGLSKDAAFRYHEGAVFCREHGCPVSLTGTIFENEVLGLTGAAAVAALSTCGISLSHAEAAARDFQQLPHRMQDIGTLKGVRFVDDSKATNLAALSAALKMTSAPIRLIAGGLPKHEAYEPVKALLAEKVAEVYLIGEAASAMASAWQNTVPCTFSTNLEHAARSAWEKAKPGETILLSPACASFDQFSDFKERGNRFVECVKSFMEEKNT